MHCRRGAVVLYLIIKEPLAVSTDNSGHSSRPSEPLVRLPLIAAIAFRASRPSG